MEPRSVAFWIERITTFMVFYNWAKVEDGRPYPPELVFLLIPNLFYLMCFLEDVVKYLLKQKTNNCNEELKKAKVLKRDEELQKAMYDDEEEQVKSKVKADEELEKAKTENDEELEATCYQELFHKVGKNFHEELQRMKVNYDEYKALCDQDLKTARDILEEEYQEKMKKKKDKWEKKLRKQKEKCREDREKWEEERSFLKCECEKLRWT